MVWNPRSWAMQRKKLGLLNMLPGYRGAPIVGSAQGDIGDIPGMLQGWREKLFPGGTLHNFPGSPERPPLGPFFPHDETDKWGARKGIISKEPTYPWLIRREDVPVEKRVPATTDTQPRVEVPAPAAIYQDPYPGMTDPTWGPESTFPAPPTKPSGGNFFTNLFSDKDFSEKLKEQLSEAGEDYDKADQPFKSLADVNVGTARPQAVKMPSMLTTKGIPTGGSYNPYLGDPARRKRAR